MMQLSAMHKTFGETLTELRTRRNLSNRGLAELAEVPYSLIPGLQSGKRRVGESRARRIGIALGLEGERLEQFVLQAINGCTEKVLKNVMGFPASLINFLPLCLRTAGILPAEVRECRALDDHACEIQLTNGSIRRVETHLVAA